MTERIRDLSASDIAEESGYSLSKAYEIMQEMPRIKHGNTVRVTRAAFNKWRQENTIQPCRASTVTPTDITTTSSEAIEPASKRRTAKRRALQRGTSNAVPQIRHTQPRTKPRSVPLSSSSSGSNGSEKRQKAR